jgi:hypothetical protein
MARQLAQTTFEKGEERGRRETLSRLLAQKFGALGTAARSRLDALPPDQLGSIEVKLFSATSLADLGLEDAPNGTP